MRKNESRLGAPGLAGGVPSGRVDGNSWELGNVSSLQVFDRIEGTQKVIWTMVVVHVDQSSKSSNY